MMHHTVHKTWLAGIDYVIRGANSGAQWCITQCCMHSTDALALHIFESQNRLCLDLGWIGFGPHSAGWLLHHRCVLLLTVAVSCRVVSYRLPSLRPLAQICPPGRSLASATEVATPVLLSWAELVLLPLPPQQHQPQPTYLPSLQPSHPIEPVNNE